MVKAISAVAGNLVFMAALFTSPARSGEDLSGNDVEFECIRMTLFEYSSFFVVGNEQFRFDVPLSVSKAMPPWPDDKEYPPLSPRRAIAVASDLLPRLLTDSKEWKFSSVGLERLPVTGNWIYVVKFERPPVPPAGEIAEIKLIVLMDGMPIIPRITSRQDPTREIRKVLP